MTREEAICKLRRLVSSCPLKHDEWQAIEVAIEALKERPRVMPVATIKLGDEKTLKLVKEAVDRARPRGEWVKKYNTEDPTPVCSVCGFDTEDQVYFKFCPNCGADMRKEGEKSEIH